MFSLLPPLMFLATKNLGPAVCHIRRNAPRCGADDRVIGVATASLVVGDSGDGSSAEAQEQDDGVSRTAGRTKGDRAVLLARGAGTLSAAREDRNAAGHRKRGAAGDGA